MLILRKCFCHLGISACTRAYSYKLTCAKNTTDLSHRTSLAKLGQSETQNRQAGISTLELVVSLLHF